MSQQREEQVFGAVLQLPQDQRAAYLENTCAGNPELRADNITFQVVTSQHDNLSLSLGELILFVVFHFLTIAKSLSNVETSNPSTLFPAINISLDNITQASSLYRL